MAGRPFKIVPPISPEEWGTNIFGQALLAGRLVATAVSPADGTHITVRFSAKSPPEGGGRWQITNLFDARKVYVDVPGHDLSQGDSIGDFNVGTSTLWATNSDERRVNAARYVLLVAAGRLKGDKLKLSTTCLYCGRPLTDPVSIDRGIGPECWGKVTGSQHQHKGEGIPDDYEAMQRAGERGDMEAVERHAAALTDAEVVRLGSLEAAAGVPDDDDAWMDEPMQTTRFDTRSIPASALDGDLEVPGLSARVSADSVPASPWDDHIAPDDPDYDDGTAAATEFIAVAPGQDPRELL